MSHTDPIADMLTRIRNATTAQKPMVDLPASKLRIEITKILQQNNFIRRFIVLDDGKSGTLKILLKYAGSESAIQGIQRASVPGRRLYAGKDEIPRVKSGLGIAIVSTSKGVLTDSQAREQKVGGEVLCRVW